VAGWTLAVVRRSCPCCLLACCPWSISSRCLVPVLLAAASLERGFWATRNLYFIFSSNLRHGPPGSPCRFTPACDIPGSCLPGSPCRFTPACDIPGSKYTGKVLTYSWFFSLCTTGLPGRAALSCGELADVEFLCTLLCQDAETWRDQRAVRLVRSAPVTALFISTTISVYPASLVHSHIIII
jgi:hypothetical protein